MALAQRYVATQSMDRGGPSGLADVLDVLLDKGLVIDAFVRVSLVGIELLTVDARIVIASVDTYLRFAEAVNRLDLLQANRSQDLGELVGGGPSERSGGRGGGDGSKALEGSRRRQEDETSSEKTREAEPSRDAAPERSESRNTREAGGAEDDETSILTRIKERGRVF
jgi:gas vesicle structural protein